MHSNRELNISEVKQIQLQILDYVHEFCERVGIEYFLSYGSLIGAIRHNGYIPWDDDIDICMTRPNYNRFLEEFNQENSKYKCANFGQDSNFLYTFAKVIDTNTELVEESKIPYKLGINIDVLPIDGINDDTALLKKQIYLRKQSDIKTLKLSMNRSIIKNVILIIARILLFAKPHRMIISQMISNAQTYGYQTSKKVCCVAFGSDVDTPFPKELLEPKCLWRFEEKEYYVPVEYDRYLRSIYGDYMTLPPEGERVSHHAYKAYKKEV